MRYSSYIVLFFFLIASSARLLGQENQLDESDDGLIVTAQDTAYFQEAQHQAILIAQEAAAAAVQPRNLDFKPDPIRAIWLGAVVPGYGQIINRKYWKLPIVYAGFFGCYYAVDYNSRQYVNYKNAYLDIVDDDDNTNSYLELIPDGYTIDSYGGKSSFTTLLKSGMEKSRYNRDLSVIITIAYYGLTLIDAFVDAHLFDYDISPDLSLKIRPSILRDKGQYNQLAKNQMAFGLAASINF